MSSTIDNRVVEMRFDNQQFESRVSTTMGTLEKLKNALKFDKAGSGLDELDKKVKNTNFSPLSSAVESVQVKFSALEVAAMTALSNIVNRAVDAGIQLVKSLSVDQISAGFNEYELKMGSIQTIMAGTGESLETVNKYLDELNTYADKTIYSFSDMTSNIGKFTNSGVKLEDAVSAIQGVSNVAAVSGANANEASRAMYNFAQALSAGYVKLIDWKSIENANMATVEFKQQLLDTALAMGTVRKEGDKYVTTTTNAKGEISDAFDATSMFNDSLNHQWMTTDVLVQALSNYSTDIRTMSQEEVAAYEEKLRAIGYTEEQIKAIEELGQKAFDAAQDVKTFSQLMDTLKESVGSGWAQTFEIIFGDFEEAKALWTSVNEVVGAILQKQADSRNDMLKEWKAMGGREMLMGALSDAYRAFLKIANPVRKAFEKIFPPMTAQRLMDMTAAFRKFTHSLAISPRAGLNLQKTFEGLFSIFGLFGDVVKEVYSFLKDLLFPGLSESGSSVLEFTADLGKNIKAFREWVKENGFIRQGLEYIYALLSPVIELFKQLGSIVWDSIKKVVDAFSLEIESDSLEESASFAEKLSGFLQALKASAITAKESISNFFASLKQGVDGSSILSSFMNLWTALKTLLSNMSSMLGSLIGKLTSAFSDDGLGGLIGIIGSISFVGFISTIKKLVSSIKSPLSSFSGMFKDVSGILGGVKDSLTEWQSSLKASTLLKLAAAVGILAFSLSKIASIDEDKLSSSLAAITVLFADLTASMAIFSRFSGDIKKAGRASTMMLSLSLSILLLASALKEVSSLSWSEIGHGLTGLIGLMGSLVLSMKVLSSGQGKIAKGALSILAFAAAIRLIIPAFQVMSNMEWEQIGKGLVGIGGVMIEFALGMRAMKGTAGGSASMLLAASALLVLLPVLVVLGHMNLDQISNSLIAIGGALLELSIALNLMKGALGGSASLLVAASALLILTPALAALGFLSTEQITSSLTIIGGALSEFAIALNIMKGTLGGSAALLVAAAAIDILTPALMLLGQLDLKQVGVALTALAGSFAVIGLAGLILKPLIPSILGLSAAFLALGVSITAFGAGIALAGVGIAAIAAAFGVLTTAGAAGATAIVASLAVIISGLASLIPEILVQIGNGLIAVCQVIEEGAPQIGSAIKAVVLNLVDVLVTCVPQLAHGALELVSGVLKELVAYTPGIVGSLIQFIIGLLDGIADNMPQLITSVMGVIGSFFSGVADALASVDVDSLIKTLEGIGLLTGIVAAIGLVTPLIPTAMLGVLGLGVILTELALVLGLIGALVTDDIMANMDRAINFAYKIGEFFGAMIGGVAAGVMKSVEDIGTSLSTFSTNAQPFLDSMSALGKDTSAVDGIKSLGSALLELTAADFINTLSSFFGGGVSNFGESLSTFGEAMVDFSNTVSGNIDEGAVTAAANAGTAMASLQKAVPKTGGWWQEIAGESDMETFGKGISAFAQALIDFNDLVVPETIDQAKIESAAAAGEALSGLQESIPKTGGWWQEIAGESDMVKFSDGIVAFGGAIVAYKNAIGDTTFDTDAVNSSIDAGEALSGLQESIPKTGGWWQEIAGESDISDFGEKIVTFAGKMVEYANAVSGFSYTDDSPTKSVVDCSNGLSALASSVKDSDSGKALTDFSSDVLDFGIDLSSFYSYVSSIDSSVIDSLAAGLSSLVTTLSGVTTVDTTVVDDFSSSLSSLASNGITSFCNAFSSGENTTQVILAMDAFIGVVTAAIGSNEKVFNDKGTGSFQAYISGLSDSNRKRTATESIKQITSNILTILGNAEKDFATHGTNSFSNYIKQFQNGGTTSKAVISTLVSGMLSKFSTFEVSFKTSGANVAKNFINGIQEKADSGSASSAASSLASSALNALKGYDYSAKVQGSNFGVGFVNGIYSDVWGKNQGDKAYNAAYYIGQRAVSGLRAGIDAHSPSKKAGEAANDFGIGFITNLIAMATKVGSAATEMGDTAVNRLNEAVQKIPSMLTEDIDMSPVVSPIIDLSGAQKSAEELNGMFNHSVGITTSMADVTGVSVASSERQKYLSSDQVNTQQATPALNVQNHNEFNITSNNPEEVANRVSYILQKQVERKESVWGRSYGMGSRRASSR